MAQSFPFTTYAKILIGIAIVGALNWGLVGLFNWNLVNAIFGGSTKTDMTAVSRAIYVLVGLCGLGAAFLTPWAQRERRIEAGTSTRVPV